MNRRHFLKSALAAGIGLAGIPGWAGPALRQPRTLVLVELVGGNDGLNTLIPFADPAYRQLRPTLGIAAERVIGLTDGLGLHPSLEPLKALWDARELALIQGIGYANPNRSHFRSIDIWNTASDSEQVLSDGWLGAALPALREDREAPIDGLVLDGRAQPLRGDGVRVVSAADPDAFVRQAGRHRPPDQANGGGGEAWKLVVANWRTANATADYLRARLAGSPRPPAGDDSGLKLVAQMAQVARLIEANIDVPVFKVSLKGFDTHAEQAQDHADLLAELATALRNLRDRLTAAARWNETLVVTYSEFGRRAAENGSLGTDHGAASMAFALGGAVKGGLYGAYPSLTELAQGDLAFTLDYRALYSTVVERWFGLPHGVLRTRHAPPIDLIA